MARRVLAGVGSLLVLLVVIIGVPVALALVAGNPIPTGAQWQSIVSLQPDYGNEILLTKVLPLIAWVAWALFAVPWLWQLVAQASGHPALRQPIVFRGQQRIAVALIGAVLVMFAGGAGVLETASPAQAASTARVSVQSTVSEQARAAAAAEQARAQAEAQTAAQAAQTATLERADLDHVVAPGDTLWGLSQQYLGDGADYPEIFQASTGLDQPGGRHITDPNLIYPGQHVIIPDAGAPITPPAPAIPAPAPADITTGAVAGTSTPEQQTPTGTPAPQAQQDQGRPPSENRSHEAPTSHDTSADENESTESDFSVPLATALGVGGILAAGLLAALGRRRLRQRRRRKTGERIAMPAPAAADYELELRLVENPNTTADLDNALRHLQAWAEDTSSPLPELLAVRVDGEEIAFYLTRPAQLPAPFESVAPDDTAWVVRGGQSLQSVREAVSPYPALVTIGNDAQGGVILLDLEQLGSLNIAAADEDTARGMLTAIAVELASNPWSEGARVTLVGIPVTLAREVDRYRVQHVDDIAAVIRNLECDLDDRRAALESYGTRDVHDARARAAEFEAWAPHIVILAEPPDTELGGKLAELIARSPRLGIATIAHGVSVDAAATITITDAKHADYVSSTDAIPSLPFEPQLLVGRELELVQALLETAEQASHPADLVTQERGVGDRDLTPLTPMVITAVPPPDELVAAAIENQATAAVAAVGEPTTDEAAVAVPPTDEPAAAPADEEGDADLRSIILPPELAGLPRGRVDGDQVAVDEPDPAAVKEAIDQSEISDQVAVDEPDPAAVKEAIDQSEISEQVAVDETASALDERELELELAVTVRDWPAPYIRVLGPIDALNVNESDLPGRGVELLAYLALRGRAVPGAQVQQAMWPHTYDPSNNNLRTLARQVRSALGNAPDGSRLLPEGRKSVGFVSHPAIHTDWGDFLRFVSPGLKATSDENLIAALGLVRGAPFTGATRRRGWWVWRDREDGSGFEQEMYAQILDAAEELGSRALACGDYERARFAARAAKAADYENEAGWRLELRAAIQAGDMAEFNRVLDDLYARVGGGDPSYQLDEITQELVDTAHSKLASIR